MGVTISASLAIPYLKALKAHFDDPGHIPDRFNRREECHVFPDGWASAICTNWMRYVRRLLGPERTEFHGFSGNGSWIDRMAGGHDFALVDGRYVVDGWAMHVAGLVDTAVLDLHDPQDAETALALLGPRSTWERGLELEAKTDAETPAERRKAMRGVRAFGTERQAEAA